MERTRGRTPGRPSNPNAWHQDRPVLQSQLRFREFLVPKAHLVLANAFANAPASTG